ncbi:HAMP domain-containing sensor histidine kinase [Clostridium sp.]|uniref:sensor histidine kinase n=1 Tax=Clostridium sp. TaxID=1506 RepID=UPI0026124FBD|nr:HAMP domain-containing sensor histidine kinase [Clostridium sp.]
MCIKDKKDNNILENLNTNELFLNIDTNDLLLNINTNEMIFNDSNLELINVITELKEKNIKYDNFLMNITHDLRGHLNIILSIMQVINKGDLGIKDKKALEYLQAIKRNSLKMLRLINNLIDTNKLENRYYILNKKNVEIISLIEGTINCIDKYARQKDIQLVFDTNKEECFMAVDSEVIDRIIMNLISNAIKFSDSGTNIYINMFIYNEEIKLSIRDEGPGISKEYQSKIFNRFYQMENKSSSETAGSGIGLDLVSNLVKSHDGFMELNSVEGVGSEFIITIPITEVEEEKDYTFRDSENKIQMLEIEFSDLYS